MEELIDVLDEFGSKTGIVKKKSEVKRDGDFHRGISICVINDNNELLMQKRHSSKKIFPNLWSFNIKGHVASGESSIETCIRETKEELGIDISENQLKFLYTYFEDTSNASYINKIIFDQYLLVANIKLKDIVMAKDEVSDVKYMSYDDLRKAYLSNDETITPNWESHIRLLEFLENFNGEK